MSGTSSGGSDGPSAKLIAIVIVAIVALIFILQNSQRVTVDFIFTTTETPLFWALLISTGLGFIAGLLAPRLRRGRKKDG